MRDHRLSAVLVLLVFTISFNRGHKVKANERRTAGLVPYPRIGRNDEMSNFPRPDRASGLLHYPRVGRSDASALNFNRFQDPEFDGDLDFYTVHDVDFDVPIERDLGGHYYGKPMLLRHVDRVSKDNAWQTPEHMHGIKDFRVVQKADDPRLIFAGLLGGRSQQGQLTLSGYTPKLLRENEQETVNSM